MTSFFFRYVIKDRQQLRPQDTTRVVVIVDQQEARARQRLLLMHPDAIVTAVEQTPFGADCTPTYHPLRSSP